MDGAYRMGFEIIFYIPLIKLKIDYKINFLLTRKNLSQFIINLF